MVQILLHLYLPIYLFIEKDESPRGYKQIMFVNPKNAHAELWDGPRTGIDGVKELFGADEVS